jgi:hypothetical protein
MRILFSSLAALALAVSPIQASCGMSPEQYALDTVSAGTVVVSYPDTPRKDTTYFRRLADTLTAILRGKASVSVAHVTASRCAEIDPGSSPEPIMRCSIDVRVDTVLKGPLAPGQELRFILDLTDFPDFYAKKIDKGFLLYHDSLTATNITIRPPCYGFEHGFFVENGIVTSREVALGHSIRLDSLARQVGTSGIRGVPRSRRSGSSLPGKNGRGNTEVTSAGRRAPERGGGRNSPVVTFPAP